MADKWLEHLRARADGRRYVTPDGERLAAGDVPPLTEYYSPAWEIYRAADVGGRYPSPAIVVFDYGDGSSVELARRILELLNSGDFPEAAADSTPEPPPR